MRRQNGVEVTIRDVARRLRPWLVGLLLTCLPLAATAADEPGAPPPARESMPVQLANRTIVILRGPIAGYTAKERATGAMRRIDEVLRAQADPAIDVQDVEEGRATRVLLGGRPAFLITPIDIDPQAGETTQVMARESARRLARAIREWHEQRTPRYLAVAAALSAGVTIVFAALLWVLVRGTRLISRHLSAAAASHAQKLRVGGVRVLGAAQVLRFTRRLLAAIAWAIGGVLTTAWLTFVLERFPYTRPWGEQLGDQLLGLFRQVVAGIAEAIPGLLLVAVIAVLARLLIRAVGVFFDRVEQGTITLAWIDPDTAGLTRRIANLVVCLFALVMAYPYLPGASTDAFKGLSVLVGLMVTFGGASVVGQAFSGLILTYTKAFRRGDYVRIGDTEGTVTDLGVFATKIRTGMGEEITLPNSGIMSLVTKNYSRAVPGTGYMVDTVVTIGYSTPWRQVEAMLVEAARRIEAISPTPPPMVRQIALSDYFVEYRLFAYTPIELPMQRIDVLHRLHANIQDVFNEHGVQIMSPHYMMDPAAPQVVPKDRWYLPPATPGEGDAPGRERS